MRKEPVDPKAPAYLMNTKTREIYPYTKDLAEMVDPPFVPFEGELPPPSLEDGMPIAPDVVVGAEPEELTPEERVRIIAGALPLIDRDGYTEAGNPGLLAVEKASKLDKVSRKEVNDAIEMRTAYLAGLTAPPEDPGTGLPQDNVTGEVPAPE